MFTSRVDKVSFYDAVRGSGSIAAQYKDATSVSQDGLLYPFTKFTGARSHARQVCEGMQGKEWRCHRPERKKDTASSLSHLSLFPRYAKVLEALGNLR